MCDLGQQLGVGLTAGRGLGVHERHHAYVTIVLERVFELLWIDRIAPGFVDCDRHASATLDVLDHAAAKHAVAAHDHLVTGRNHVDEAVLHADRARPGYREGERIFRLVGVAQQRLQLLHHLDEDRIEITDRGLAHGGEYPRVNFGGTRAHQRALRRMEGMDALGGGVVVHRFVPWQRRTEQALAVGPRFQLERFARGRLVQYLHRTDLSGRELLDLHGPARRHVADLDPIADHGAIDAQASRHFGLAAEKLHQTTGTVHYMDTIARPARN